MSVDAIERLGLNSDQPGWPIQEVVPDDTETSEKTIGDLEAEKPELDKHSADWMTAQDLAKDIAKLPLAVVFHKRVPILACHKQVKGTIRVKITNSDLAVAAA